MNTEKQINSIPNEELLDAPRQDMEKYVLQRYDNAINYYWNAGGVNSG